MPSNIDSFLRDTQKEINKLVDKQKSEGRKIILGAYSHLVDNSAVDTGLYKSSHIVSFNSKSDEEPSSADDSRIDKSKKAILKADLGNGDTITIQNNLKYASRLEASPQHSKQQEPALYGRTEAKAQKIINKRFKI